MKQPAATGLVENPFIKKKNRAWTLDIPSSEQPGQDGLQEDVASRQTSREEAAVPAALEAGEVHIENHFEYFAQLLERTTLSPFPANSPHLSGDGYRELYNSNFGSSQGSHFIIHQHDHPIAGTHYDLRLQINETSSASWAIMYGVPGDPNSQRLNRNATETRIHCLWNHLIETASMHTGSLLIWDTGTYSIVSRRSKHAPSVDPDSERSSSESSADELEDERPKKSYMTEQEKLHRAFANRKIRIRLHGTRLPDNYVLNLRLTKKEDVAGRQRRRRYAAKPPKKRRRRGTKGQRQTERMTSSDESEPDDSEVKTEIKEGKYDDKDDSENETVRAPVVEAEQGQEISALEKELRELEDEEVRRTNAYTGAENTIGSIHQRRWYLSLDREACGFVKRYHQPETRRGGKRVHWVQKEVAGDTANMEQKQGGDVLRKGTDGRLEYPFYVHGVTVERSVVTGRRGEDILHDEGVMGYTNRQGWKAVTN